MPPQRWWRNADREYLASLNLSDAILKKTYEGRARRDRVLLAADKHLFLQLCQAARRIVDDDDFCGCNCAEIVQRWVYSLCGIDLGQKEIHCINGRYHNKAVKLYPCGKPKLQDYLNEPFQVTSRPLPSPHSRPVTLRTGSAEFCGIKLRRRVCRCPAG